ncbi:phage terminase [Vibrio ishigakensis]|uniref:Phage terminase n=1 Tax=Vibrio ishigakensis TaxID=1481914 RepID=A0A0B8PA19_9VIBR|nr:phage terminase [Vibrio ishigakensis]
MLKSFVNLTLGEPWEDEGSQRLEAVDLIRRREGYAAKVPSDVLYLTFAADVQADRIEGLVCGWTEKEEMYVIEWQMFRDTHPNERFGIALTNTY